MTDDRFDQSKSFEGLSGYCWFAPKFESNVIVKSHAMRCKKLADLSVEDVRMDLSQHVGTTCLVPIALKVVEDEPFAESLNFPAEIALALLLIPHDYRLSHPGFGNRLQQVDGRPQHEKDIQAITGGAKSFQRSKTRTRTLVFRSVVRLEFDPKDETQPVVKPQVTCISAIDTLTDSTSVKTQ